MIASYFANIKGKFGTVCMSAIWVATGRSSHAEIDIIYSY